MIEMHLDKVPFDQIMNGTKTIELRLFDEKRRELKRYDRIRFLSREKKDDYIKVELRKIHVFPTFEELFRALPMEKCGYEAGEADPKDMLAFYSREEQEKYGVVGLEFDVIRRFMIDENGERMGSCAACKRLFPIKSLRMEQSCGPFSEPFCRRCLAYGRLPYDSIVWKVTLGARPGEDFTKKIPDYYLKMIREQLPFWHKTEEEFIGECCYRIENRVIPE